MSLLKVNHDGSVTGGYGGASFVIRRPDSKFIVADESRLFETTITGAELRGTWKGISYERLHLKADQLVVERDSTMKASWILRPGGWQAASKPLLHDIWRLLVGCLCRH